MDQITFLGTGGARVVMSTQALSTGGFILEMNDTLLSIDPGPGAIVHSARMGLDLEKLEGVLLSHRHLDHCGDVNVMIEAMTHGGFHKRGSVFAPRQALYEDPVILRYLWDYASTAEVLEGNSRYTCGKLGFHTSMPHRHGEAETYGFLFQGRDYTLGYLPDTRYFPELSTFYRCDICIISMLLLRRGKVDHLSVPDVITLLKEISPSTAILTHFGMTIWREGAENVADRIAQASGKAVIAAKDGMTLPLAELCPRASE